VFESTMILINSELDECEYCGHAQCMDCDEWMNFEWFSYWLE
jgi:hypothetical protein